MTTLVLEIEDSSPVAAHCDADSLHVTLADGRTLSVPLWWYPRLAGASPEARRTIEFMPMGLHWPELDEDISVASMLRGDKAPGAKQP
jgi:hypothetical protein